ncbi:MDR family MFS transporter [Eupransor demetentiae]|uniref:MFS family (AraJ) n=1 Tax=Eupransor demetentiae TaxID=3109584 RepID=A0ABM9N6K1_9LACO|nr:MFS family (AraJ) [Lactobacillaceae bacterium LMG 33000]
MKQKKRKNRLTEKWLLLAVLLSNTGNSMIWPITTLYMTSTLHQTFTTAGLVLMIGASINILGAFVGGKLFDHWDPHRSLVIAGIIATSMVTALIFWNGWPVFAILIWLANFGMGAIQTLVNAYATTLPGKSTRVIFNNMYIVLNIGVVLGTLAVGYLFDYGFWILMAIAAALYFFLLVLSFAIFRLPADNEVIEEVSASDETAPAADQPVKKFRIDSLLAWIGALLFITYLSYMLWETIMAPHMKALGLPTRNYADLWMINGVTIIIFQKPISNWANRNSYRISVILGALIFATSFLLMPFVKEFWQIVLVFELLTVGEMLESPQVPAWVSQITPPAVAGQAQGFVSMMISSGRVVGPIYAGVMMDHGLMNQLFLSVFFGMLVIIAGLYWITGRKSEKGKQ